LVWKLLYQKCETASPAWAAKYYNTPHRKKSRGKMHKKQKNLVSRFVENDEAKNEKKACNYGFPVVL
jgi:hypothetical protein